MCWGYRLLLVSAALKIKSRASDTFSMHYYQLRHVSISLVKFYFWDRVLLSFPGWIWTWEPPVSASQVLGITDMSHNTWNWLFLFLKCLYIYTKYIHLVYFNFTTSFSLECWWRFCIDPGLIGGCLLIPPLTILITWFDGKFIVFWIPERHQFWEPSEDI